MTQKTPIYNFIQHGWITMDKDRLAALVPLALAELALVLAEMEGARRTAPTPSIPPADSHTAPSPVSPKKETVSYKVDWSKAPDWANYHAFSTSGNGWWFKFLPMQRSYYWDAIGQDGEKNISVESNFRLPKEGVWQESLTKRETDYTVDWTKAPAWAMYHIYNADGMGSWYKFKPVWTGYWLVRGEGGVEPQIKASHFSVNDCDSKRSLTERPKQTKPVIDWSTAPHWAIFHAFDNDGNGWWYASKPVRILVGWDIERGNSVLCKPSGLRSATPAQWRDSLVKRP